MTESSSQPSNEPDLCGRQLGDYHVLRRLGRGGMSEVYLAEQGSLGRKVAMKVLKGSLAHDETYVRRFQNEARSAAALVHANIVQIYDVGNIDGVRFIAQEYVPGQNLRQLLTRTGPLDLRRASSILRQSAAALNKAAQAAIVHRDIKPENILLTLQGEVKVADFGLARLTTPEGALNLTQVGVTMGTPLYMSPEQVEGKQVDPRSDLYSLGATTYHMLAGRPPFDGETALAIAVQHLNASPARLEDLRPDLPPALCRVVHRLLAKKPEDRFATPADLIAELRNCGFDPGENAWGADSLDWQVGETLQAPAAAQATQKLRTLMTVESARRRRSSVWWWPVLVGAGLVLGGGAAKLAQPSPLLGRPSAASPRIAKLETSRDQYLLAMQMGTEAAFKSVERYFSEGGDTLDAYYVHRARQQLAELYLEDNRLDRAMTIYEQLAALPGEADQKFRAVGLMGEANIFAMREDKTQAKSRLAQLLDLEPKLDRQTLAELNQQMHRRLRPMYDSLRAEIRGPATTPGVPGVEIPPAPTGS